MKTILAIAMALLPTLANAGYSPDYHGKIKTNQTYDQQLSLKADTEGNEYESEQCTPEQTSSQESSQLGHGYAIAARLTSIRRDQDDRKKDWDGQKDCSRQ
jgi:hypothetical protein